VADLATRDLDPVDDVHADGAYRRRAAAVLVRRAVEEAGVRG
jgi:CO/xanthine dehydrogenase FAD-binding subunit